MTRTALATAALSAAVLAGGCQNRLHDENQALYDENRKLRDQFELGTADDGRAADLESQLTAAEAENRRLREEAAAVPAVDFIMPEVEGAETSFDQVSGELTMSVAGDVLFGSGRSDLKDSAKQTLDNVAQVLQDEYANRPVRVEGHTDADPVTKTKKVYTDNFGLASARALAVTRYLQDQGVDPSRLSSSAYGEYQPRGADKAQNRRVEIVVVTR